MERDIIVEKFSLKIATEGVSAGGKKSLIVFHLELKLNDNFNLNKFLSLSDALAPVSFSVVVQNCCLIRSRNMT